MTNSDDTISPYYSMWISLDEEKFDVDFSETKKQYWRVYKAVMDAPKEMDLSRKEMRDLFNKLLDVVDELYDEVRKEEKNGI